MPKIIGQKGKSKEARDTNWGLDNIKAQIVKHYQRIADREIFVTAKMVRNAYQYIGTEYETLLGAFDKDKESFKRSIGIDRSASSYKMRNDTIWLPLQFGLLYNLEMVVALAF